jgi:carbon storage regulator
MLVLSRRANESIKLGESIVITVVRVVGDKVRIGIEAPSDMVVLRHELEPHERELVASPDAPALLPRIAG